MKAVIGIILILAGILLGIYVGGWLFFIGGIVQIIEQIQSTPVDAYAVAFGILKIILASAAFWICTLLLVFPGMKCLKD